MKPKTKQIRLNKWEREYIRRSIEVCVYEWNHSWFGKHQINKEIHEDKPNEYVKYMEKLKELKLKLK